MEKGGHVGLLHLGVGQLHEQATIRVFFLVGQLQELPTIRVFSSRETR